MDMDEDGYGDPGMEMQACPGAEGFVDNGDDCADANPDINPGADERCDGGDNNCNGSVDEDSATDATEWYLDSDRDGYGDPSTGRFACNQPFSYVSNPDDCDDSRQNASPRASEVCNYADDNCDGIIDEDSAVDAGTWYLDLDGDGYSNSGDGGLTTCWMPAGYGAYEGDCDNQDASINPAAVEVCDGIDNDCSSIVDDNAADSDSSGAPDCEEVVVIFAATNVARLGGSLCGNGLDGISNSYTGTENSILAAGLYGQRLDEDSNGAGVQADLSVYAAILLNDVGYADGWAANTYSAVNAAAAAGVPVIFLGDDAAYSVLNADNNVGGTSFRTLMGLGHFVDNGFGGTVRTVAGQESNLLVDGPFGAVGTLSATGDLDIVELAADATAVMALEGYPVVWTRDDGTTRSVGLLVQGYGAYCNDYSSDDLTEAETLLSNALYWATDSQEVIDLDGDGAAWDGDCDDQDPTRAPNLSEVCDGLDSDCVEQDENGLRTSRTDMDAYVENVSFNTDSVTVGLWVQVQDQSAINFIASKQSISNGGHYAWGLSEVSGDLYARFEVSYNTFIDINTRGLLIQPGDWFHVAISYDSSSGAAKLYYNGTEVASDTGGTGLYYGCTNAPLTLGYASYSSNFCETRPNQTLDAGSDLLVDDFAIYASALSASDISGMASVTLPSGYIALWDFSAGGGTTATDRTGNFDLTLSGTGWDYTCPL
ncbi:MAG TPA: MopE-related protein, partial [Myxococcota bacterium]|nr:MopE-related protein [Myxococcota bacterium]